MTNNYIDLMAGNLESSEYTGGYLYPSNIRNRVEVLKNNQPVLSKKAAKGKIQVARAFYDLDTGRVELVK